MPTRRGVRTSHIGKLLIGAAVVLLVTATASLALHRFTPPFVQVTTLSSGEVGTLAGWAPDQWAFESNGDVVGNGNATWQIFIFSLLERDFAGVPGLEQITFGAHNARNPSISRNGQFIEFFVAFEADGDLCADSANNCEGTPSPMSGRQLFVYSTLSKKIRQITRVAGDCVNPSLSGNGRFVVFESKVDINSSGATGGIAELYQADIARIGSDCPTLPCVPPPGNPAAGTGVTRVTRGGGTHGVQSFNGLAIAFESRGDLVNNGANPGPQHIYLLRKGVLSQLTSGSGEEARNPSITQNGTLVAYAQDKLQPSGPPLSQIFLTKSRTKKTYTTAVTNSPNGASWSPSLSANGRFLGFTSNADLLGNNTTQDQVYAYNVRRQLLSQITAGPNGAMNAEPTIFILSAFVSTDDFKGNGNATQQFFVANPFRNAPKDFVTPPPGTPTPMATPGDPAELVLSLVVNGAQNNGDGTLTTVVAAVVTDAYGDAVPDGIPVDFSVAQPVNGVVATDGAINSPPTCDVSHFQQQTGAAVTQQPGVAHGCVIFPTGEAGTTRVLSASVTPMSGQPIVVSGSFTLPHSGPAPSPTP